MKALNLDDLAKESRTITFGGKTYAVIDMTVENYIETNKEADRLGENPSELERIESYVAMVGRFVPDMDEKTLRSLSVRQLAVILEFINGTSEEAKPEGAKEGSSTKKKPK